VLADPEPLLESVRRRHTEWDDPLLATLAHHPDSAPIVVDMHEVQCAQFRYSDPSGIQQLQ